MCVYLPDHYNERERGTIVEGAKIKFMTARSAPKLDKTHLLIYNANNVNSAPHFVPLTAIEEIPHLSFPLNI